MEATGRREGQRARLQSKPYQLYYKACLTFYYHMYGSDMGTLKILLNDQVVWRLDGNQGDQWHIANIPILHPGLTKVSRETIPYNSINPTRKYNFYRALIGQKKSNIHPYSHFSIHLFARGRRTFVSALF